MTRTCRTRLMCMTAVLGALALPLLAGGDQGVFVQGEEDLPRTVAGRVVDPEGRPIPGVRIWTRQTDEEEHRGAEPRPVAITGPDGTFTARGLRSSWPLVAACPPGWVYEEKVSFDGPVELRLRPATRISGRVVDRRGEPVAEVQVEAELEGGPDGCARYVTSVPPPCTKTDEGRSGVTDAEGRFVFESLEPGWYAIRIVGESSSGVRRRRGAAGQGIEGVEFVLEETSSPIEGRLLDAAGAPVAGAQVTLSGARPRGAVETDAAGGFLVPAVLSGRSRLEVQHPDLGWLVQDVQVEDRPLRLDLRMSPATLVHGGITGPGGAPVEKPELSVDGRLVEVAADGSFRLAVPRGEHEVKAQAGDLPTVRRRITAGDEPIDLEIRMAKPGRITGRLTGLYPGERGRLSLKEDSYALDTMTQEDGSYAGDIAPGVWTLVASDASGRVVESRIQAGEGETVTIEDIHFPPLPPVRGRVLEPAGGPMAATGVLFLHKGRMIRAWTGSDGSFVTWLGEGSWTVRAERSGFGPAVASVEVSGGEPIELPDLRLSRLVAVSGRVLGVDPEVVIQSVWAEDDNGNLSSTRSKVDQDNRFRLENLWPGTWTVGTDIDGRPVRVVLQIPADATEMKIDLDADAARP